MLFMVNGTIFYVGFILVFVISVQHTIKGFVVVCGELKCMFILFVNFSFYIISEVNKM